MKPNNGVITSSDCGATSQELDTDWTRVHSAFHPFGVDKMNTHFNQACLEI